MHGADGKFVCGAAIIGYAGRLGRIDEIKGGIEISQKGSKQEYELFGVRE